MDSKEFLNIIKKPDSINPKQAEELAAYSREYPYCQNIHILLARYNYLANKESNETIEATRIASLYSTDRSLLRKLLTKSGKLKFQPTTENKPAIGRSKVAFGKKSSVIFLEATEIESADITKHPKGFSNALGSKDPFNLDVLVPEIIKKEDDLKSKLTKGEPFASNRELKEKLVSGLDQLFYNELYKNIKELKGKKENVFKKYKLGTYAEPALEKPGEALKTVIIKSKQKVNVPIEPKSPHTSKKAKGIVTKTSQDKKVKQDDPKAKNIEIKKTQTKKLSISKNKVSKLAPGLPKKNNSEPQSKPNAKKVSANSKPAAPVKNKPIKKLVAQPESVKPLPSKKQVKPILKNSSADEGSDDGGSLLDYLNSLKKKQVTDELPANLKEVERQKKIIENFIRISPSLPRAENTPLSEDDEIVDLSEQSTVLSNKFVSENLAGIYERQKNYPKAIETYEALILKYPFKKGYFAKKIKNLKK